MADHGQGSRRAQGRPGVLRRRHRDRAGRASRACTASAAGRARRAPYGVYRPATRRRRPRAAVRARRRTRTIQIESVAPTGVPVARSARRRSGGRAAATARPTVASARRASSAPARATRAATPTSACSPAPTTAWAWLDGFLTTERLRRAAARGRADLPIERYRLPEHPLAQLRDPRAARGRRRRVDPAGRAGQGLGEWLRARVVPIPERLIAT